jgi:hypothetical protein
MAVSKEEKVSKIRQLVKNPFKPGAGHMPPYLAGREHETKEFMDLLSQDTVLKNLVLTGLRGLGKTVLLERFKPLAIQEGWLWAGTDLSESTSISEENLATRLLTDLSVVTSSLTVSVQAPKAGFMNADKTEAALNYQSLKGVYDDTPGLVLDKLKGVLEFVWPEVQTTGRRGIVFAYDEAQNLADHKAKDQYPLSLLLDLFQSLQRKDICFMLALTGLPTLFPKLVEARTFSERMFHVVFLDPLSESETVAAIQEPVKKQGCPIHFTLESCKTVWNETRGYPYFVQYVCREVFDVWVQAINAGRQPQGIPVVEITRKLDTDFFAGRWARATDRQRELLWVASTLPTCDSEFTVQELVENESNKMLGKPFSSSHANQMLASLCEAGLVYKNRHGKYAFAVPLLANFIKRQVTVPNSELSTS